MRIQQRRARHSALRMTGGVAILTLLIAGCGTIESPTDDSASKVERRADRANPVEIEIETQRRLGVQFSLVQRRNLERTISLTGMVGPDAARVAEVRTLTRGRLTAVDVTIGDRVRQGQVLAAYDDIELGDLISQRAAAIATLQQAEIESGVALAALDRARTLVQLGALAEAERQRRAAEYEQVQSGIAEARTVIEQIERKLRRLGAGEAGMIDPFSKTEPDRPLLTAVTAPIGGVITGAEAVAGEAVEPSETLFTIADISDVWVQGNLHEKDIGQVRQGAPCFVFVAASPDRQFEGVVTYVGDLVDPASRTLPVRCVVQNPRWELKLGMFATLGIPVLGAPAVPAVPSSSIQTVAGNSVVFVRKSPTIFDVRTVTTGVEGNGWVEVLGGVSDGEEVVAEGSFQVKSILLRDSLAEED